MHEVFENLSTMELLRSQKYLKFLMLFVIYQFRSKFQTLFVDCCLLLLLCLFECF